MSSPLHALGWADFSRSLGDASDLSGGLEPARVISQQRGQHDVRTATDTVRAMLRGNLLDDPPVVGDWVALRRIGDQGLIERVLPRRTVIQRKRPGGGEPQIVAANVDRVAVVTAPDADFNLRRIERYVAVARGAGCEVRVVLTKGDLPHDPGLLAGLSAPLTVSARTGEGLADLQAWIGQATVAFLGSSGVGKSSLLNALLGAEIRATGDVRASDGRGQHTTTTRDLLRLPGGGAVIDTPGMREIGMSGEADADEAFPDLAELASLCAFRDCGHLHEPGCAVLAGVSDGSVDPTRVAAWFRLGREAAWEQERADVRLRRARTRASGKLHRAIQREKRR